MKRIGYILLALAVLATIPLLFSERIISRVATQKIEEMTGLQASFDEIYVGIVRPVVRIRNLVLSNPPDFPHPEMLTVKELYVRYDWLSLFGKEIHLDELRLDVPRIVMVKPEGRASNIELLTGRGEKTPPPTSGAPPATSPAPASGADRAPATTSTPAPAKPARTLTIQNLRVKLGELEVRQYGRDDQEPIVIPVPVGLDRSFSNVTNVDAVITELSGELVMRSTFGLLNNMDTVLKAVTDESGNINPRLREQFKDLKKLFRP